STPCRPLPVMNACSQSPAYWRLTLTAVPIGPTLAGVPTNVKRSCGAGPIGARSAGAGTARVGRAPVLRRRLQPGAVAGGRLARRRGVDAPVRSQPGDRRGLCVVPTGTPGGGVRVRMARPRARPPARRRHPRLARYPDRFAAAVVYVRLPGRAARDRERRAAPSWQSGHVLRQRTGLPGG